MDRDPRPRGRSWLLGALVVLALVLALRGLGQAPATREVPYSELLDAVEQGRAAEAELDDERVRVRLREPEGAVNELVATRLPGVDDDALVARLRARGATIAGVRRTSGWWLTAILGFAPLLLLGLLAWGSASAAIGRARPMSFGRSRAKLYDRSREAAVTFADVAGVDDAKAELAEVIQFLRDPGRYTAIGARVPKGVLLVGPPGTGKTLLARAVAGEAAVPFFSLSGSEFVEMFVGVGAARVRDLFEQAKSRAPCIVFIDELDAVGKTRAGAAGFVANEEREQTLNQLLVEMDGFDSGSGLILMAATNRPEILDRALLRAGRFDRRVVVDRPDVRGRRAILEVHARKVRLATDAALDVVAQRTPGMVGADLAHVVNEAALASIRRGDERVAMVDFEEAVDRLQLGLRREGRVMTTGERQRVAIHEAGHAVVAARVEHADPVHRVTILPRSMGTLGATLQLPTEERYLMTRAELDDRLVVLLAGRAAERIACGDVSTGAESDLAQATELARLMVTRYGMSDRVGPRAVGRGETLGEFGGLPWSVDRTCSERVAVAVDASIADALRQAEARATALLTHDRAALDAVAAALVDRETLHGDELVALLAGATLPPLVLTREAR